MECNQPQLKPENKLTLHDGNSYIPPSGVVILHIVSGVARHKYARPHPREGYNCYITCYLGNITVEERYDIYV